MSEARPGPGSSLRFRAALGVHLALSACVVAGAHGPWWDVLAGSQVIYRHAGYDGARPTPLLPLAAVAAGAAVVAAFFTSYDLVSQDAVVKPVVAASLVALVCAGVVLYDLKVNPSVFQSVVEDVQRAGVDASLKGGAPASARPDPLTVFSLTPCWGAALVVAAAPLMFVVSLILTLLAKRAPEST